MADKPCKFCNRTLPRVESQAAEIERIKAQNRIMQQQRTQQISENQLLKAENEKLRRLAVRVELLLSDIPERHLTTQEKGFLAQAREVLGE
ncbi:MAG: hypothetical protein KGL39_14120 [Patescibacteria group bacterium]|nr:hypothetical protein [Patescibacteria group bacterium]